MTTNPIKDAVDTVNTTVGSLLTFFVIGPLYLGKIVVDDIVNIHLKK